MLGDFEPGQFYKFDGTFDELAVYDRALDFGQIAEHHAIGRGR